MLPASGFGGPSFTGCAVGKSSKATTGVPFASADWAGAPGACVATVGSATTGRSSVGTDAALGSREPLPTSTAMAKVIAITTAMPTPPTAARAGRANAVRTSEVLVLATGTALTSDEIPGASWITSALGSVLSATDGGIVSFGAVEIGALCIS